MPDEDLGFIARLMMKSDVHRRWTIGDFNRLVVPPVSLGQYIVFRDPNCYVSWGLFSEDVVDGFRNRSRKLMPGDWDSGNEFVFVDFICPDGGVLQRMKQVRAALPHVPYAKFFRSYGTGAVKKVGSFAQ